MRIAWLTERRLIPHLEYIADIRTTVRMSVLDPHRRHPEFFEESLRTAATTIQAADPRNKVYSFTGMLPARLGNRIPFDYNRSVATVFADAAQYAITNTECLGVLSMAGLENVGEVASVQDCPSWVGTTS